MSTIFAVSFLGTLFAIAASLLLVYTYVTLRLIPKLKRSFSIGHARGVAISKAARAMFGDWLSAARDSCEKLAEQDQEKVA